MPTPRDKAANAAAFNPGHGFPDEEGYDAGDWKDADELLGSGIPSVTFPEIGATISGIIVDRKVTEQRDPTGNLRTFDNGDVRRQLVLTIQTSLADNDEDDGQRRLFVKGGLIKPFRLAMRKAKVSGPRPGGELTVTYVGDGMPSKPGLNPPKLYEVTYVRP